MKLIHPLIIALLASCLLGMVGCTLTPHSDPMKNWKGLGTFSNTVVPEIIKQDAQAYFQTLPKVEKDSSEDDHEVTYWEDGTGQHAVILHAPHDGEHWHHALIYDRGNRRIKVLKYSTGSYGITDVKTLKHSTHFYMS